MSQYGMQMPGGQLQRGPSLTVYTGLLAFAAVALVTACVVVYLNGAAISPDGNPFHTHTYDSNKKSYDVQFTDK